MAYIASSTFRTTWAYRLILSCAIQFLSVWSFWGNLSSLESRGAFPTPFPENNRSYRLSENKRQFYQSGHNRHDISHTTKVRGDNSLEVAENSFQYLEILMGSYNHSLSLDGIKKLPNHG